MPQFIFYVAALATALGMLVTGMAASYGLWQEATWDLIFTLFLIVVAICSRIEVNNKYPQGY